MIDGYTTQSPSPQFRHRTEGEGNISQFSALVVSAATAHKTFGPTNSTSTYSACTWRVFGGTDVESRPFDRWIPRGVSFQRSRHRLIAVASLGRLPRNRSIPVWFTRYPRTALSDRWRSLGITSLMNIGGIRYVHIHSYSIVNCFMFLASQYLVFSAGGSQMDAPDYTLGVKAVFARRLKTFCQEIDLPGTSERP
ncbi:hypothetical protein TNCV_4901361 [Trichonephila clavipes]|nr:hypothetical protein TNCV_4901361 [Trichonephila clavipes]